MKKRYNKGFMLAETLVVTTFVAGVLIFLFIQFTRLSNSYNEYYKYNSSEDLYSLARIKFYIENDTTAIDYLNTNLTSNKYLDISNCSSDIFSNARYCSELLRLENIDTIYIVTNPIDVSVFEFIDEDMQKFIKKTGNDGAENYRLVAKFNDGGFATIRLSNS